MIPEEFVGAVLSWGGATLRNLPWRRSRDPWGVLVSEVMSQQTQVHRVIPKWEGFMARFPTPQQCADASLGEVLQLWQGLGYPRRARDLHRCSEIIVQRGRFPSELDELLEMPGIGDYTARAVLAFAFGADVAVVDTNVGRVLARVVGERLTPRSVRALADGLVPEGEAWLWNQSLMDLGGTICRSRSPQCNDCPVQSWCVWKGDSSSDDPAVGSAGVSGRQSSFEGSRRQARGRLLKSLAQGPVVVVDVSEVMGRPKAEAESILAGLVGDGLCQIIDGVVVLPR